jgi:hypothetical protein
MHGNVAMHFVALGFVSIALNTSADIVVGFAASASEKAQLHVRR